ncbi:transposase, partial [Escherichia coli]
MKKRNFSAEFKRESAQLVVDQKYTVADAAKAMDVGLSTMTRWVKQLRDERQGKTPKASPITPEQIEIRKLRKKLQRIEMENEILKKATVDSICQCNTLNRPGFPGECFICELRLPDHRFRWKHNKLFLLLPEEYGPAFP